MSTAITRLRGAPCERPRGRCRVRIPATPWGREVQQPPVNLEAWRGPHPAGPRGAAARGPPRPLLSPCPPTQPGHRPLPALPRSTSATDHHPLMSVRSGGPSSHPPAPGSSSETDHQALCRHLPVGPQPRALGGGVERAAVPPPWVWLLQGPSTPCTPSGSRVAPSKAAPRLWGPPGPGVVPAVPPLSSGMWAGGQSGCAPQSPLCPRTSAQKGSRVCLTNPGAHSKPWSPLPGGRRQGWPTTGCRQPEGTVFSPEAHGGWRDPQLSHEGD